MFWSCHSNLFFSPSPTRIVLLGLIRTELLGFHQKSNDTAQYFLALFLKIIYDFVLDRSGSHMKASEIHYFFKLFENYRKLTSQWFIFYAIFSVIFHNKNAFKEHGTKYCGWIQSHYLNNINVTVHILLGISTLCYIWHFSIFLFFFILENI